MPTQVQLLTLWKHDPLLHIFRDKLRFSGLSTTLALTVMVAVLIFGLGWVADRSYVGSGLHLGDTQFTLQMLVFAVFGQLIWIGFYAWQPGAIAQMFQALEQSGVIHAVSESGRPHVESYASFLRQFQAAADRRLWAVIAAAVAAGICVFEILVAMPVTVLVSGRPVFWFDVKWFTALILVVLWLWQYVVCMIALRVLQTIVHLGRMFQWFSLRLHPLHSDEAGGLGALGRFTLSTGLIIVAAGALAAIFSMIDLFAGTNPLARPDLLLYWGLYIAGTPMGVVAPMLSAHRAMQAVKNEKLNEIAQEFEKTLSDESAARSGDAGALKQANERLQALQTRYSLAAESLPTWPVSTRLFRNFSLTASLPLLSGLVSMVIKFAVN